MSHFPQSFQVRTKLEANFTNKDKCVYETVELFSQKRCARERKDQTHQLRQVILFKIKGLLEYEKLCLKTSV